MSNFKTKFVFITILMIGLGIGISARALTYQEIFQNQNRGQVLGASTTGLVGYWNFDEGSGATAGDLSGNNNTGTLTNGPTWTTGKVGSGSLQFDGVDDYVNVPDSASLSSLEGSNGATISFWINRNNTNGGSYISRYGTERLFDITGDTNFTLRPQWRYSGTGSGGSNIDHACSNSQCPLPVGTWHHVVVMYNNPTSYIYIDGVLKSSQSGNGGALNTGVSDSLKIGGRSLTYFSNASIDDLRIYNRALTNQEILDIYNGGGVISSGDTQAPTIPSGLSATAVSSSQINLTWNVSTDNVAVAGYKVYRGGIQVGTPAANSYSDSGLTANTAYSYTILAYDAAGNNSSQSTSVSATTQAGSSSSPTSGTFTVKQDGSGNYTTIQACANAVTAGSTCLVYPGVYPEHVKTVSGGTSDSNRVTFKAQGLVTMKGFDIKHQYVTVDGFDISGFGTTWGFNIQVQVNGNYCKILNNTIRDDIASGGIGFITTGGITGNYCEVKNNVIKNLGYTYLAINGAGHLVENNTLSHINSRDYIYVFGHDSIFRNNIFLDGNTIAGVGNHPDWVQTFGDGGSESYNMLFEHNWIQDLDTQLGQLNSQTDLSITAPAMLSAKVHDWILKNNVFVNVSSNMNVSMPGVKFINNTFYRVSYQQSGIGFGGTLKRGDASRTTVENNAFVAGGSSPDPYGYRGYYSKPFGVLSKEVLYPISPDQTVGSGVFNSLLSNGYIDSNGKILDKAKTVTDISQFILDNAYSAYKSVVYDLFIRTVQLDASMRSTFVGDYNFVSEDAPLYAAKSKNCTDPRYIDSNFCETHGINGGDPKFQNLNNFLGSDGIPFTLDDGLKPLPGSPFCGKGENGADIGAYSCSPNVVFSDSTTASTPSTSTIPIIISFTATPTTVVSGAGVTLAWVVAGNPAPTLSINNGVGSVTGTSVSVHPTGNTTYTLTATNSVGYVTSSVNVLITLSPDVTSPTAYISSPSSGTVSGSVMFSVSASDPAVAGQVNSGLKLLSLLIDGNVFATSSSGTISKSLDTITLSNAMHNLTAIALDNAGNSFVTPIMTISVSNATTQKFPRTITLTSLEGISSIPANLGISVSIVSPSSGVVLGTQTLTPTAGKYTVIFQSSDPQLVNLRVKVQRYLSYLISTVDTTLNTATILTVPTLLAGDNNNDDIINSLDYSLLNTDWLKFTTSADINGDGIVNSLDFAILKNNFNRVGQ